MTDFETPIMNWLIIGGTIGGIAFLLFLIRWMSGTTIKPGESPETMGHVWDGDLAEYNNPLPGWWLKMFYLTIFFGVVYLILFPGLGTFKGILGWTSTGQYDKEMAHAEETYAPLFESFMRQEIPALATDPKAIEVGRRLYLNYCATCHGSDAGGVRGFPNLRDHDWLYGGEPEKLVETITNGRSGLMPAWDGILKHEDIFNVANYVRSLSGSPIDSTVKLKGEAIYQTNCAACHGLEGGGNQMMGAPNLADNIWLYGGSQQRVIDTIVGGRNGKMPAHGAFLGEAKIHLLAAYIYSLTNVGDLSEQPIGEDLAAQ